MFRQELLQRIHPIWGHRIRRVQSGPTSLYSYFLIFERLWRLREVSSNSRKIVSPIFKQKDDLGEAEGMDLVQPAEEMASGDLSASPGIYGKVLAQMEPGSAEWRMVGRQETMDLSWKEVQAGYKEKPFPHQVSQVVKPVVQKGYAASTLGRFPPR